MRPHLAFALSSILLSGCAVLGWRPTADEVIVSDLNASLPSDRIESRSFLFKIYHDNPELKRFDSYRSDGWEKRYAVFADHLTKKATSQGFDAASLRGALDSMFMHADEALIALLPVGAYQTSRDGKPAWIVVARWGYPGIDAKLEHFRVFAFDQATLESLYIVTCM